MLLNVSREVILIVYPQIICLELKVIVVTSSTELKIIMLSNDINTHRQVCLNFDDIMLILDSYLIPVQYVASCISHIKIKYNLDVNHICSPPSSC